MLFSGPAQPRALVPFDVIRSRAPLLDVTAVEGQDALSRGQPLRWGKEQDVEAKALRSVRWYARRWREQLSQKWLQSCRKMPSPAASCWAADPQRWIDIKRNQCPL